MQEPPQLASFDTEEQRLYSELLLDVQAPHSILKAETSHPLQVLAYSFFNIADYLHFCSIIIVNLIIWAFLVRHFGNLIKQIHMELGTI